MIAMNHALEIFLQTTERIEVNLIDLADSFIRQVFKKRSSERLIKNMFSLFWFEEEFFNFTSHVMKVIRHNDKVKRKVIYFIS